MTTIHDAEDGKTAARGGRSPASQKRRHDILVAGQRIFFTEGYQLASVDRIAAEAGTTKRTVYDHFGSKEALFAEVIAFASQQFVGLLPALADLPDEPTAGLNAIVDRLRALLGSPDIIRFQRIVIAEAERQPEFGHVLCDTAFGGAEGLVRAYLAACIDRGQLRPQDVAAAARLILNVSVNALCLQSLMGKAYEVPSPAEAAMLQQVIGLVVAG